MKASFIIGFHSARMENLLQTVRFLECWHFETVKDCELITVCQDSCDPLTVSNFSTYQHHNLNLSNMHLPHVTNFGVDCALSDKLVILESDRILPKGYFASALNQLEIGCQISCANMKKLTKPASDQEIADGKFEFKPEFRATDSKTGCRNIWSGNTIVTKQDYFKAGKMDEGYIGYGWADTDMTKTMEKAGMKSIFRDEMELHLWHTGFTYGKGDQKAQFINNGLYYCKKWNEPIPEWLKSEIALHSKTRMFL